MKFVRYQYQNKLEFGLLKEDKIYRVENFSSPLADTIDFIEKFSDIKNVKVSKSFLKLDQVELLCPISRTQNDILCVGLNYRDHIEESKREFKASEDATYFSKRAQFIAKDNSEIFLDSNIDSSMDYETELAVIIGKSGKNISKEDAPNYIWGYSILNDYSARELQRKHNQFFKGKSLDYYTAIGPVLVTKDEIKDPVHLNLKTRVNGELRQDSNTKYMIRDINTLISELSSGLTLVAGDIIATGTPKGVGLGFNPQKFLKSGDIIESEIENIGILRNKIV